MCFGAAFWVLGGWVVGAVGALGVRFRGLWGERKFVNFGAEQKLSKNLMLNRSHDGQKFPKNFRAGFLAPALGPGGGFSGLVGRGGCACALWLERSGPLQSGYPAEICSRGPAKVGRSWPLVCAGVSLASWAWVAVLWWGGWGGDTSSLRLNFLGFKAPRPPDQEENHCASLLLLVLLLLLLVCCCCCLCAAAAAYVLLLLLLVCCCSLLAAFCLLLVACCLLLLGPESSAGGAGEHRQP